MAEYIDREAISEEIRKYYYKNPPNFSYGEGFDRGLDRAQRAILDAPTADVAPVVRCKDCKHSTLPSELTQRYGKPGTLTCHNMHAPSNRRNVGSNDFCSYGEPKEGTTHD